MGELKAFLDTLSPAGPPAVLLQHGDSWLAFTRPLATLETRRLDEVAGVLEEVEAATAAGRWAAGFLAYEAAPAFDPALAAHPCGPLPLAWWGIFEAPRKLELRAGSPAAVEPAWRPATSRSEYRRALRRIRRRIAAGDTYQVNYTFPLEAEFAGDPRALFAAMHAAQRGRYSAFVEGVGFAVCSASPELFFALDGERILTRPMKGTARRGRYPREDDRRAARLAASEKDRAENVMIVDMMRNDLAKVAERGSVRTEELFRVETYPTVHQLTSTVAARTRAPLPEVLRALFPCASITGAPKVSTTRIIREVEARPRGVYTGAVGFVAPERRAQLAVAIRTAAVDREAGTATFGTGGGIVWDSDAEDEYEECRAKALVLGSPRPAFALLETLLWRAKSGYFLLERHLDRLLASVRYFGYAVRRDRVRERLLQAAEAFAPERHRVRLKAHRDGRIEVEAAPEPCAGRTAWKVGLDTRPVDDSDVFLFHKTTHRTTYEAARRRRPDCDETVLWNARGELTEATRANLALKLAGEWLTPPVRSGLLAGTYRAELLARGRLREAVLPVAALAEAEEVKLVNSVRGWIRAERAGREKDANFAERGKAPVRWGSKLRKTH